MIVDAHHHFWNPAVIPQPWMTEEHVAIARAFEPADLEPCLERCGVGMTVLVQSAAEDRDTDYMFEQAEHASWVGAITGWCRLDDIDSARRRLDELAARPKLRAIRHLIHQEPDPHWILRDDVQPALALLAERELLLELPAVFPDHLGDVPELARRHSTLRLVIDHLAKPPLGTPAMAVWREQLEAAAGHENVVAKVSGLNTALARPDWDAADLEPAVQAAFDAFGPRRLLFGSDWPVALLNGSYERVVEQSAAVINRVAGEHADAILAGNAVRLYGIEPS
jgi:L-fuconolactonase